MEERKSKIKELITCMYHEHDLSMVSFKNSKDKLTNLVWDTVKDYPEIVVSRYTVFQILLESIN